MITYGNAIIVTMNTQGKIFERGYITVDEDQIIAIGPMSTCPSEYEDIDGNIIMPGFINAHTHLGLIFLRGMADDMADRLRRFLFPMENEYYDSETIKMATAYGAYESLLVGSTTVFDMYYDADSIASVLAEVGIRGIVGQTIINNHKLAADVNENSLRNFIEKYSKHKLIKPALAPHAPYSIDDEDIDLINRLSEEYNVLKMMHINEMDFEMEMYQPQSPIEVMAAKGMIDRNFIGVHAIHTSARDWEILQRKGAKIVACIGANMKAGKGIPNIFDFINNGIDVCLGTDGPVSGNTLDINNVMKLTAYSQKTKYHDRTLLPAQKIVKMATCDAAKILNLPNVGCLAPGKQADMIFIDTHSSNMQPIYDVYTTIVYSMYPSDIYRVVVAGKILVDDKKIVDFAKYSELKSAFNKIYEEFKCIYDNISK